MKGDVDKMLVGSCFEYEEKLKKTRNECHAREIYEQVNAEDAFLEFASRYVFCHDELVVRNALWVLTKAGKDELSPLHDLLNPLVELAMQTENSSVRRMLLCVVERLNMTEDDLRTDFLDFCFDQMMNLEAPPAIQAVCMKLAYRMCCFYPELTDELTRTLESMETDFYKPAVRCVRNRVLNGTLK